MNEILLKHKKLDKNLIILEIQNYNKSNDKEFLYGLLDDIYNLIFEDMLVYDLILWKTDSSEHISFYVDEDEQTNMTLEAIYEKLRLLNEVDEKVKITISEMYKFKYRSIL